MGLIDEVSRETEALHAVAGGVSLLAFPTSDAYRSYLVRLFGFVFPVERSILSTPRIERYVDIRRFHKHELLRRDLMALHMTYERIGNLPLCAVPALRTPEEALGWAYPIERSTLDHGDLFRRLASTIPGELAFASSYLKCYLGMLGEMWSDFGDALNAFARDLAKKERLIDSAKAAARCYRTWHFESDREEGSLYSH